MITLTGAELGAIIENGATAVAEIAAKRGVTQAAVQAAIQSARSSITNGALREMARQALTRLAATEAVELAGAGVTAELAGAGAVSTMPAAGAVLIVGGIIIGIIVLGVLVYKYKHPAGATAKKNGPLLGGPQDNTPPTGDGATPPAPPLGPWKPPVGQGPGNGGGPGGGTSRPGGSSDSGAPMVYTGAWIAPPGSPQEVIVSRMYLSQTGDVVDGNAEVPKAVNGGGQVMIPAGSQKVTGKVGGAQIDLKIGNGCTLTLRPGGGPDFLDGHLMDDHSLPPGRPVNFVREKR